MPCLGERGLLRRPRGRACLQFNSLAPKTRLIMKAKCFGLLALLALGCQSPVSPEAAAGAGTGSGSADEPIKHYAQTSPVSDDADDPAIWVRPGGFMIVGTDKTEVNGGLYLWDSEGKELAHFGGLDRPNNVDIAAGFPLGEQNVDLAITTERVKQQLRIFVLGPSAPEFTDVTGSTKVFLHRAEGETRAPMGITVLRDEVRGEFYCIVSAKEAAKENPLALYRLKANGGKVDAEFVQDFGHFSGLSEDGEGEIEALKAGTSNDRVFYADELAGIRWARMGTDGKMEAQPDWIFGTEDYVGDREGMATFVHEGKTYLVSSDQIEERSRLQVWDVTGDEITRVAVIDTDSDDTDGLEIIATGGPSDQGVLVMMSSKDKAFFLFDLAEIRKRITG